MSQKKAWVVVEVGYEYDDSYYNRTESAGDPVAVFTEEQGGKQAAKEYANKLTLKREGDLTMYLSESDASDLYDQFGVEYDDEESILQLIKEGKFKGPELYTVVEVSLGV